MRVRFFVRGPVLVRNKGTWRCPPAATQSPGRSDRTHRSEPPADQAVRADDRWPVRCAEDGCRGALASAGLALEERWPCGTNSERAWPTATWWARAMAKAAFFFLAPSISARFPRHALLLAGATSLTEIRLRVGHKPSVFREVLAGPPESWEPSASVRPSIENPNHSDRRRTPSGNSRTPPLCEFPQESSRCHLPQTGLPVRHRRESSSTSPTTRRPEQY